MSPSSDASPPRAVPCDLGVSGFSPSDAPARRRPTRALALLIAGCAVIIAAITWARLGHVVAPSDAPWLYPELFSLARDRILAAVVIGANLGVGGVLLRTATSNPLADPHIIGVNAGAAFGAVAGSFFIGAASGAVLLPGALIGAALAATLTVGLSLRGQTADLSGANAVQKMVLLGIAISAVFSALTSIFLVLDEAQLTTVLAWLNGRLAGVRAADLWPAAVAAVVLFPLLFAAGRACDALATGDAVSRAIGANPARVRQCAIAAAVVLTATCVAAAGPIGFLGLLAAVCANRVCGHAHRLSLPAAAAVGATVLGFGALPAAALTPIALCGALCGAAVVFAVAGRLLFDPARLALTGVAVSVGLAAVTQLLLVRMAPEAGAAMTWLKGSLYARTLSDAVATAPVVALGLLAALLLSRHLNALSLDDATMSSIGVRAGWLRLVALLVAVACGAAAVAAAGVLGFVGLIVPHAARLLVGRSLSRQLPVAAVAGVAIVVAADAVGRWAFAPTEIPVGALIAIAGAPYFIYLVLNVTSVKGS